MVTRFSGRSLVEDLPHIYHTSTKKPGSNLFLMFALPLSKNIKRDKIVISQLPRRCTTLEQLFLCSVRIAGRETFWKVSIFNDDSRSPRLARRCTTFEQVFLCSVRIALRETFGKVSIFSNDSRSPYLARRWTTFEQVFLCNLSRFCLQLHVIRKVTPDHINLFCVVDFLALTQPTY